MLIRKSLTASLMLALVLVACTTQETVVTPTATAAPANVPDEGDAIAEADQSDVEANTLGANPSADALEATYTDEETGFSFNYPGDWYVQSDEGSTAVLTSYPPEEEGDTLGQGETKIDIVLLDSDQQLEALLESQEDATEAPSEPVTEEAPMQLSEGTTARVLTHTTQNGQEDMVVVLETPNANFLVSGQGDLTYFNQIIESLH